MIPPTGSSYKNIPKGCQPLNHDSSTDWSNYEGVEAIDALDGQKRLAYFWKGTGV